MLLFDEKSKKSFIGQIVFIYVIYCFDDLMWWGIMKNKVIMINEMIEMPSNPNFILAKTEWMIAKRLLNWSGLDAIERIKAFSIASQQAAVTPAIEMK